MTKAQINKLPMLATTVFLAIVAIYSRPNTIAAEPLTVDTSLVAQIATETQISETNALLTLNINIQNTSSKDVYTKYILPNFWDVGAYKQYNMLSHNATLRSDPGTLTFDFGNNPLLPGKTYSAHIVFELKNYINKFNFKYYSQKEFNDKSLLGRTIKFTHTQISYPKAWGQPTYLNLKPGSYTLTTNGDKISLAFPGDYGYEIAWVENYQVYKTIPSLSTADNKQLQLLGRISNTQVPRIINTEVISEIYKDDSGNIFVTLQENTKVNLSFEVSAGQIIKNNSSGSRDKEELLAQLGLGSVNFGRFNVPDNLRKAVESVLAGKESLNSEQKLALIITEISKDYSLEANSLDNFEISEQGLSGDKVINYGEYLLLINELSREHIAENQIVIYDMRIVGKGIVPVLEICKNICEYYNLQKEISEHNTRALIPIGMQIAGFDGINQLIFTQIKQIGRHVGEIVEAGGPTTLSQTDKQPVLGASDSQAIKISQNIPEEIKNFSHFSTDVSVENQSDRPIFLEEIVIANNSFPIIDNNLGGLHQGVLPGGKNEFKIDNVYLPKFFLREKERVNLSAHVVYSTTSGYELTTSQHSVLVRQNFLFLSLLALGIFSTAVALWSLNHIYAKHKYLFKGAYWQAHRKVADVPWQIKNLKNRGKKGY